jgi:hypothetical protein
LNSFLSWVMWMVQYSSNRLNWSSSSVMYWFPERGVVKRASSWNKLLVTSDQVLYCLACLGTLSRNLPYENLNLTKFSFVSRHQTSRTILKFCFFTVRSQTTSLTSHISQIYRVASKYFLGTHKRQKGDYSWAQCSVYECSHGPIKMLALLQERPSTQRYIMIRNPSFPEPSYVIWNGE